MTPAQRQVLEARVKSFLWRLAAVMILAALNWLTEEITRWGLSEQWVVVLGLLLGELTKYLNSNVPWLRSQQQ
jgi:hypothetical protein